MVVDQRLGSVPPDTFEVETLRRVGGRSVACHHVHPGVWARARLQQPRLPRGSQRPGVAHFGAGKAVLALVPVYVVMVVYFIVVS